MTMSEKVYFGAVFQSPENITKVDIWINAIIPIFFQISILYERRREETIS